MQVLRDLTGGSRGSYVECELCERRYLLPLGWAGAGPRCGGGLVGMGPGGEAVVADSSEVIESDRSVTRVVRERAGALGVAQRLMDMRYHPVPGRKGRYEKVMTGGWTLVLEVGRGSSVLTAKDIKGRACAKAKVRTVTDVAVEERRIAERLEQRKGRMLEWAQRNGALASYSVRGWSLWFKAAKESATDTLPEGGPYALTMDGETGVMSPIDESVEKM